MNAQEIFRYIDKIHTRIGFAERIGMLEENWKLFDELYELAATVEPYDKYRDGEDRMFWIRAPRGTYEEFAETFQSHFTETTIEDYFAGRKGVLNVKRMKSQCRDCNKFCELQRYETICERSESGLSGSNRNGRFSS